MSHTIAVGRLGKWAGQSIGAYTIERSGGYILVTLLRPACPHCEAEGRELTCFTLSNEDAEGFARAILRGN